MKTKVHKKLNELASTAICGNDISSSIDFQIIKGKFSPTLIKELSIKWNIPVNFMFIGSPSNKFPYKIEELGGVRLII